MGVWMFSTANASFLIYHKEMAHWSITMSYIQRINNRHAKNPNAPPTSFGMRSHVPWLSKVDKGKRRRKVVLGVASWQDCTTTHMARQTSVLRSQLGSSALPPQAQLRLYLGHF